MAVSYYGEAQDFLVNHLRVRRLSDGHLVTTDHGSWAYLNDDEFRALRTENLSEPLVSLLKEKGIVLTPDTVGGFVSEYRTKTCYLSQGTSLHIVVPTIRCNQQCVYCHANALPEDAQGADMTKETMEKTVDLIFQSPSPSIMIEFQGGEPLLRFDLVEYCITLAKERNAQCGKKLSFSIVTNLTLMRPEYLSFLKRHCVGICTSLDGNSKVHDANRANHALVRNWIDRILNHYSMNAMVLVTRQSLGSANEIVDEYADLGLAKIFIKPVNKLGYAEKNWDTIGLSAEEYLDFWKQALARIVERNRTQLLIEQYTYILLRKILTGECVNFTDLESPCGAAIAQLAYSQDGGVYTCDEGRQYEMFRLGTVDNSYGEIITSRLTKAMVHASINDNPVCERCAYKPYCGLCPVCSFAETGNVISKLPDRRCKILIGMFDHLFEKILFDPEYRKVFFLWLSAEKYLNRQAP
jgi:uncharacterized protein